MKPQDNKPLDVRSEYPPKQEGTVIQNEAVHAFAVSLQGASHMTRGDIPCQDYSDIRWLEKAQILIAGIADGVGSCALSHWGAYFAVTAALDFIEKAVAEKSGRARYELTNLGEIQEILINAFHTAQDQVEQKADEAQQAVFNFQSTLTVALYDGIHVYCCHCGDDGVVVQEQGGMVKMVTKRLKGEEASSVYPLQSGPAKWQITGSKNPAAGFVMATDGVLDAFVPVFEDYYKVNYNQGIYYPFMKPAMDKLSDSNDARAAENALEYYKNFLNSPEYRKQVTDDLTVVAVVSPQLMRDSREPRFNVNIWKSVYEEHGKAVRARLEGNVADVGDVPPIPEKTAEAEHRYGEPMPEKTVENPELEKGVGTPKGRRSNILWLLAGLLAGAVIVGAVASYTGRSTAPGAVGAEANEVEANEAEEAGAEANAEEAAGAQANAAEPAGAEANKTEAAGAEANAVEPAGAEANKAKAAGANANAAEPAGAEANKAAAGAQTNAAVPAAAQANEPKADGIKANEAESPAAQAAAGREAEPGNSPEGRASVSEGMKADSPETEKN